jgi:hypothetical protein
MLFDVAHRGAVSLALALSVKVTFAQDEARADFANKTAFYTAVVVILTLVVNAPLTAPLLNWLSRQEGYKPGPAQVAFTRIHNASLDPWRRFGTRGKLSFPLSPFLRRLESRLIHRGAAPRPLR